MDSDEYRRLARDLLRELVEIDTTDATGDVTAAATAMARRLRAGGFPEADVVVVGPHPRKANLVARLGGTGMRGPLLLLAHLDVVDAAREDWSVEPFALTERDEHFYGRGTTDDKAIAAIWIAALLRLRAEGFAPARDLVVALTADEEGGEHNGAQWLLDHRRSLVEAAFGLNEGGYGRMQGGRRIANQVQASEKIGMFLELEAHGSGGHGSLPRRENAIHALVQALGRLAAWEFPLRLTEATRAFFERMARLESGQTAADMYALLRPDPPPDAVARLTANPYYDGLLRTTCTPTRLAAGTAPNVLPTVARAVLDCRVLPDESPLDVVRTITEVIADERIRLRAVNDVAPSPPSPLTPEIVGTIEHVTAEMWPGVPVLPVMTLGATDSLRFRRAGIPMYGVTGLFLDYDDVRAHAADERVGVEAYQESAEFLYRLVRAFARGVGRLAE